MLSKLDLAKEKVEKSGVDVCIASGDVVGLYPNIQHREGAALCADVVKVCPGKFHNIDYKAAAVFLKTNCSNKELKEAGVTRVMPRRLHKMGHPPTCTTPELTTRSTSEHMVPSKFCDLPADTTGEEHRNILAKVIEVAILLIMSNHIYSWRNELWLQQNGVPTGLRVSGIIGRVSMDAWKIAMEDRMRTSQMTSFFTEKYVDDVEVVLENLPVGSRWDPTGESISRTEESTEEDIASGKSRDQITMEVWKEMASNLVPGLKFTVDTVDNHNDRRLPMLDFKLWKEEEQDPNHPNDPSKKRQTLKYCYYEKSVHVMLHHAGVESDFSMKVLRQHKTPLARQIQESVEIQMSQDDVVMNSKGEYNGSRVPRITIEIGAKVLTGEDGEVGGATHPRTHQGPNKPPMVIGNAPKDPRTQEETERQPGQPQGSRR